MLFGAHNCLHALKLHNVIYCANSCGLYLFCLASSVHCCKSCRESPGPVNEQQLEEKACLVSADNPSMCKSAEWNYHRKISGAHWAGLPTPETLQQIFILNWHVSPSLAVSKTVVRISIALVSAAFLTNILPCSICGHIYFFYLTTQLSWLNGMMVLI